MNKVDVGHRAQKNPHGDQLGHRKTVPVQFLNSVALPALRDECFSHGWSGGAGSHPPTQAGNPRTARLCFPLRPGQLSSSCSLKSHCRGGVKPNR